MTAPAPHPDADSAMERKYWAGVAEGRLPLQRCDDCGAVTHPPRRKCPECYSSDWQFEPAAGDGSVVAYTTIRRHVGDRTEPAVPVTSAVVELAEGPRVMGVIDCPPDAVSVGLAVELDPSNLSDTDRRFVFVPVESGARDRSG